MNGVAYPPRMLPTDILGFQRWKTLASRELFILPNNSGELQVFHCSESESNPVYYTYTAQLFINSKIQYDFDVSYLSEFKNIRAKISGMLNEMLVCVEAD